MGEFPELRSPRHKICLAVDFNNHANASAAVHIGFNHPLRGCASALGLGFCQALLFQVGRSFSGVAVEFFKRTLAVHYARAGLFAEFFYLDCRDSHTLPFLALFMSPDVAVSNFIAPGSAARLSPRV